MNYGRYQVIKEVGRGSMGVVFQCLDPHIDRMVAAKVLRTDRLESENFVKRFLKEAKVIGRLTHPNIVTIYDVGEEQGVVYIAMEFLEGVPLSEVVRGTLPSIKVVLELGVQLAEALDYAHQKGVVHRDMKPSNIVVQADGLLKITDFGIAHVDDATATLQTQAGDLMGTPAYMSPEQVLGQSVDGRTDIFSLGIILYELATGRRPFGGESKSLVTIFNDIVGITPVEPVALALPVPEGLSRLIMKALQKDPAERFQSGKELSEALKACLEVTAPAPAAAPAASVAEPLTQRSRKSPAMAAGVVAALVILAGGAYFLAFQSGPTVPPAPVARLSPGAGNPLGPGAARPMSASPLPGSLSPKTEVFLPKVTTNPASAAGSAASEPKPAKLAQRLPKTSDRPKMASQRPAAVPPVDAVPNSPAEATRSADAPAAVLKQVQQFAFLKVGSSPSGARVFINGAQKGTTPMIVKLDLGHYQVRFSRSGYQEVERQITLEKMKEYPLSETLTPTE